MTGQLSLLTEINVGKTYHGIDPYSHQKSRVNQHKHEVYLEHLDSERHKTQMKQVFELHKSHPEGLTDREVFELTGIPINLVSARRDDIEKDRLWYSIYSFEIVKNPDGKNKIRNKGNVRRLIWTV